MSNRTIDFVENWIRERVQPGVYQDEEGPDERSRSLVDQLMLDAEAEGVPAAEIELNYPDLVFEISRVLTKG